MKMMCLAVMSSGLSFWSWIWLVVSGSRVLHPHCICDSVGVAHLEQFKHSTNTIYHLGVIIMYGLFNVGSTTPVGHAPLFKTYSEARIWASRWGYKVHVNVLIQEVSK